MKQVDSIARRILGWKLNRWDRWYDYENRMFIQDSDFQPEQNIEHAMLIVERLKQFGFTYTNSGPTEVRFNNISGTGNTQAQAITDAAYNIIERNLNIDDNEIWRTMC
ncbi:BC1872 family protein [Niallia sp. Krafla_26]|uniref:BC1872 family protein n=1 Tax=Niallia sp. Krafla_26 TaxID=3064703 RepID=UPI003D17467F